MAKPGNGQIAAAINDHVGARVRERRIVLGLTQQQLGDIIGVSDRQVSKYECGLNRIPISLLYAIAHALDAPITHFYDGLRERTKRSVGSRQRLLIETMHNFSKIQNEKHQEAFSQLARALAERRGAATKRTSRPLS